MEEKTDSPVSNWTTLLFFVCLLLFIFILVVIGFVVHDKYFVDHKAQSIIKSELVILNMTVDLTAVTHLEPCKTVDPLPISFGPSQDQVDGILLMVERSKNSAIILCGFIPPYYRYNIDVAAGSDTQSGLIVIADLETDDEWKIGYTFDGSEYILDSQSLDLFIDNSAVITFDSA